ncbi:MAG: HigA family addiction module antidote protein [Opitutaceae bacterium]|nr:HigA family addiction module antidote protein [Opitutaceae bacterium]MBP9913951.1 HigA family addiction module antidote protein [Opitutaceae bacterium]
MKTKLPNIHPGEILREEFLTPMGITAYRLTKETGLPHSRVSDLLAGRRGVSADTALRLARYFGTTPDFWLNLQSAHDLEEASRNFGAEIRDRIRPLELAAS